MPSRINERAINSTLATLLNKYGHLSGIAEATTPGRGGAAPDIHLTPLLGSKRSVIIEAKVGTNETQRNEAIEDAKQRFVQWDNVQATIALCYPEYVAEAKQQSHLASMLMNKCRFLFVEVNQLGAVGSWQEGDWRDLTAAIAIAGEGVARAVVDTVSSALERALNALTQADRTRIAKALDLPGEPKKDHRGEIPRDRRGNPILDFSKATKIGALLLVNGALMQTRLRDAASLDIDIPSLQQCLEADSPKSALWDAWKEIREVDYHPIYDAALKTLIALPDSPDGTHAVLVLGKAVISVASRISNLRADLAGRIYHRLLDTARFDGSFYTSTPAAFLLARLALTEDFIDWSDPDRITELKICDPACGTGTLLMAAAETCHARHLASSRNRIDDDLLHLAMVEDVLNGMDINLSAVHLAASMLALSNPKVDFNKMGIYRAKFGVQKNGDDNGSKAWLGSLEMLQGNEPRLQFPNFNQENSFDRASGNGDENTYPDLHGKCDLVIMNPPFTRDSLRHDQLSREDELKMKRAEASIISKHPNGHVVRLSTSSTMFNLLADDLCKDEDAKFARVMPMAEGTGTSARNTRIFLHNKWQVETVITSHDPKRIFFSENTNIHESLMVARRRKPGEKPEPTQFINLARNPGTAFEALGLANNIINGDIAQWGAVQNNPVEAMQQGDWLPMVFYNGELTDAARILRRGLDSALTPLGEMAHVRPAGQGVREVFRRAGVGQSPDRRALWFHKTDDRKTMHAAPDSFILARKGKEDAADRYWDQKSKLLLANRIRCNLVRTCSVFIDRRPVIGSAWIPVTPLQEKNTEAIMKAWCVWSNSSAGFMSLLAMRQRDLAYPAFSIDGLRSLPFPNPDANPNAIAALAEAYEDLHDTELLPLPIADQCQTRKAIDTAVAKAFPGKLDDIHKWRGMIAAEPSVRQGPQDDPSH